MSAEKKRFRVFTVILISLITEKLEMDKKANPSSKEAKRAENMVAKWCYA